MQIDPVSAMDQVRSGDIAAVLLVGGKPLSMVSGLPKDGSFRLLDLRSALTSDAGYAPAVFRAEDYPTLIPPGAVVETVSVSAILVARSMRDSEESYRQGREIRPAVLSRADGAGRAAAASQVGRCQSGRGVAGLDLASPLRNSGWTAPRLSRPRGCRRALRTSCAPATPQDLLRCHRHSAKNCSTNLSIGPAIGRPSGAVAAPMRITLAARADERDTLCG